MSRRVCETCAWWVAGEYEHGICAYTALHDCHTRWLIEVCEAADSIRMSDDTCEHWESEEEGE